MLAVLAAEEARVVAGERDGRPAEPLRDGHAARYASVPSDGAPTPMTARVDAQRASKSSW